MNPKKEAQYQTLSEFLKEPFGEENKTKNSDYESKYLKFKTSNKIQVEGYTKLDNDCFIHIKVPSESQINVMYDVIIQFFTDDPKISLESTYENYYVKFFSNSPGFMYKYAVLYKLNGYLIESLYDKMNPEFMDTLPEKTNKDMKMYYDKSIYFACRYLSENKYGVLSKLGILIRKRKSFDRFIKDISSFDDMKLDLEISNIEKSVKKEVAKEKAQIFRKKEKKNRSKDGKILPSKSTLSDKTSSSIHIIDKIKPKSSISTSKNKISNIRVKKKVPTNSTHRKK